MKRKKTNLHWHPYNEIVELIELDDACKRITNRDLKTFIQRWITHTTLWMNDYLKKDLKKSENGKWQEEL